jgi:hypothetical protein
VSLWQAYSVVNFQTYDKGYLPSECCAHPNIWQGEAVRPREGDYLDNDVKEMEASMLF